MSREFIESFETQDLNNWDSFGGSPAIISTAGLDMKGDYCVDLSGSSAYLYRNLADNIEYYFAFYWRQTIHSTFFSLYHDSVKLVEIKTTSGKFYYVLASGNYWGTHGYAFNKTYFIQIYFKLANSGGRLVFKFDDVTDIDHTGDTQPGSDTTINKVRIGYRSYLDNFIVDNSENIGKTEIALLKPNGIGLSSNWAPSAGNNYECVDEIPINDADYNSTDIVDKIDTYNYENLPESAKAIKCVQAQARIKRDAEAVPTKANLVLNVNGANYHGPDKTLTTIYANKTQIWSLNPADSQEFEKNDIDTMEVGIRSRS